MMEKQYVLNFTESNINYILLCLSKQPFNEVHEIIHDIHVQALAQAPETAKSEK